MFPQRRMTTDTPDGNYSQALNLFVRGEDGWVQMPSRSISLNDYMKQLIKAHNADIDTEGTPEEFDMTLCEHLFDGPETIEGLLAEHYTLSWALASLRDKLKHYEDARIPEIMPEGLQTIDRAIGTYGKDAQLTKAVEEMSELTKALCKLKVCKLKYDTPFNRETQEVCSNIEEETADVFIMLVQLFAIFNPHELVNITKIVWDKEYREVRIRQVKVSSTGTATVSGGSTRTDNRVQAKTYTVKPGDCLYNISKSTLGDGGRYNEIYSLNKDKLKNPNLIYPGQVLQLP